MNDFRQALEQGVIAGTFKMERATEHYHLLPFAFIRKTLVFAMGGIRQLHRSGQRRRAFIADRMSVSERKHDDIPTLNPQRGRLSFHREVSTTRVEQVKNAIVTGQKV